VFHRIRWRIAFPYVLLILLLVSITVIYLSDFLRNVYVDSLEGQLAGEAKLIGDALATSLSQEPHQEVFDPAAYRYARLLGTRVTIIGPDGTVLGESHESRLRMDNHLYRPEVQQALYEGQGNSIRYSATVGYEMLYVAARVGLEDSLSGFARVAIPLQEVNARVGRLQRTLFIGALVGALLAVLLAVIIAERTARPVRRLTEIAVRMAQGDLNARLLPSGQDEVSQLTRAFNHMGDRLRSQVHTLDREQSRLTAVLENAASGVIITDEEGQVSMINPAAAVLLGTPQDRALGRSFVQAVRHHQLVELWRQCREEQREQSGIIEIVLQDLFLQVIVKPFREAGVQGYLVLIQDLTRIRRLETVRRDFISNISHELRTPLAGLKALVDTLRDGALDDPPVAQHFLNRMDVEVDALTQMVEELLELSRIESSRIPLRLAPTQLIDVIHPPVERLRPQAERADLALVVDLPSLPPVLADAERMQQVITNLVHNAIKFTPPGGRVRVTGCRIDGSKGDHPLAAPRSLSLAGDEWVVVAVQDNGVGIDPDDLPRIFERFFKADRARSSGGTGLGLAIAKHIVQGHGGEIWAESPSTTPFWGADPTGPKYARDAKRPASTLYFALPVAASAE
jgi:two-component system, OmpR family, phosphate regulon sensor histidine kinase PhoR